MFKRLVATAAVVLAAAGCDSANPVIPSVPAACLLARQDAVRKDTGNSRLVAVGNKWDGLDGSTCTYKDSKHSGVKVRFDVDPVGKNHPFSAVRVSLEREGYDFREVPVAQPKSKAVRHVYVLAGKGAQSSVVARVTEYTDAAITVILPPGSTQAQAEAMQSEVWEGLATQGAAAIAGQ